MISIQELGISILGSDPKSFYFLGGLEYGVKDKYLEHLRSFYGESLEYGTVNSFVDFMSKKHIVPLSPKLYIIRYDETFISSLTELSARKLKDCKIVGTLVCLYSEEKHINKLDKFFPDNTAVVDSVNPKFIEKYLHSDFPKLDDRSIKIATNCASNYGHARNICRSMSHASLEVLAKTSEPDLIKLFGCSTSSQDSEFLLATASRNFTALSNLLDKYEGDLDNIIYSVLQASLEIEKSISSKYPASELRQYMKLWTVEDVYYLFMHTYQELEKLRSNTSSDVKSSLIYLFGLLTFQRIPSLEVMNEY